MTTTHIARVVTQIVSKSFDARFGLRVLGGGEELFLTDDIGWVDEDLDAVLAEHGWERTADWMREDFGATAPVRRSGP